MVRYRPAGGNSPALRDTEDRTLTVGDRAAGVVSDRIGKFVSSSPARHRAPHTLLREVIIETIDANNELKTLRLITNLFDVSAETVARLYQARWQVELFFRWLKSIAHFGSLICHSKPGMQTYLYTTIIAVMLMYLHTGYRPSKYLFAMLESVANGSATLEEIMPILRERERQREMARLSAAKRQTTPNSK